MVQLLKRTTKHRLGKKPEQTAVTAVLTASAWGDGWRLDVVRTPFDHTSYNEGKLEIDPSFTLRDVQQVPSLLRPIWRFPARALLELHRESHVACRGKEA